MSGGPEANKNLSPDIEHFDVLIVGAGISGVAGAYYLRRDCPELRFLIVENEESFGGTWWTHRFPGIRSDSDLHTFGYSFKPWTGPPIATAEEIRRYMGEVIDENGLAQFIRYRHRVTNAEWRTDEGRWCIDVAQADEGTVKRFTANFLWMCQGYYRHNEGYMPAWEGIEDFKGALVHTERWPVDLEYTGKRVVVIGSGATAATVVPAMAGEAKHVTMLQRSPTFFRTGRNAIEIAEELRELEIDESWVHEITRRKIFYEQSAFTTMCFEKPEMVKEQLIGEVRKILGPDYDVDKHFTPSYRPWRQRIAFVPDADLFKAISRGEASVVTGHIERFVEKGIKLRSGEVLEADIIAAATGFNMDITGGIQFSKDGQPFHFRDTVTYRGMMFTGVPNLAWVFGYFRASWTLRSELVAEFVCRMMKHLRSTGAASVEPALRPSEQDMPRLPWFDDENFNPAYLTRVMDELPKRGASREWRHTQDHWHEREDFPAIKLEDDVFVYRRLEESSEAAD